MTARPLRRIGSVGACTLTVLMILLGGTWSCKNPPPKPMPVTIRILDEAKKPVAAAEIIAQAEVVARTNGEGVAELAITGREGASFTVEVRCPPQYRSTDGVLLIRRLDNGAAAAPEYLAHCTRLRHTLVVNIKTTGATNMPILHLGKEVAHTDDAGVGKVVIQGDVQERVDLQLDTSDPKLAKAHPQNPVGSFEIPNVDGETTFEQKFTFDKKPPPKVYKPTGPIRIN